MLLRRLTRDERGYPSPSITLRTRRTISAYSSGVRSGRGIDLKMATRRSKGESEPLTLGQALAAHVRLIVWCKSCNHRADPDIATQVAQHGSGMPVPDWALLLRCTECGERHADFVVSVRRVNRSDDGAFYLAAQQIGHRHTDLKRSPIV